MAVFFQVLWRSIVLAVAGGIVIAVGFVVIVTIFGESWDGFDGDGGGSDDGVLVAALIAAYLGAIFGIVLGIAAGVVLGLIGALALVPYRGRGTTRWVMRVGATVCVGAFFAALLGGDDRLWLVLGGAGMVGAALTAPWLVGWYVRRAEPATG